MLTYHDKPSSQGVENAIRRAKQLACLSYTPILPLPIVEKIRKADGSSANAETYSSAWLPRQGLLYSSVRRHETYIGYNISLETFFSALTNPNSVVYQKPITGTGQNVHNYYGIVCSCYASYCLNLHYRTNCARWPSIPGIHKVDTSALENIQLADVVLNVKKHIAVVTDIERDADGKVYFIHVSESTLPFIRTTRFTPEEFRNYWLQDGYEVYHYDGVKDVPYTPDPFAPVEGDPTLPVPFINRSLMPDFGNKANYRKGEQPVEISVFEAGCEQVEVTDPDGKKTLLPVENGFVRLVPDKVGLYEAACVRKEGHSEPVCWCVTDFEVTADKETYRFGEEIGLTFRNPAEDPILGWVYVRKDTDKGAGSGWLDLRQKEGTVTIPGPLQGGEIILRLVAKNDFGCYISRQITVEIEAP